MGKIKRIKAARKRAAIEQKLKKKRQRKQFLKMFIPLLLIALIAGGGFYGYKRYRSKQQAANSKQEEKPEIKKKYDKAPEMQIDAKKKYTAKVETSRGAIEFELNVAETPKTVNNFVFLAREKFYDGVKFHRIVKDFMIQTGDPNCSSSTGSESCGQGGPGYKFEDEKFSGDYSPGTLAMANSGANTNGSQFFIMTGDYSGGKLPKNYIIFGKVTAGMDVVQQIAETPTSDNGQGEQSKPNEEMTVSKIEIFEQ